MNFNSLHQNTSSSSSSSDDEEEQLVHRINENNLMFATLERQLQAQPPHGGSVFGHRMIARDREGAAAMLIDDYFSENPTYNGELFRRRYSMNRSLFLRIVDAVKNHDPYFTQRMSSTGKLGLSTLQKVSAVFRILAYGVAADATDEYIKIGESMAIESVKRFCRAVRGIFAEQYLRSPTPDDVDRLLHIGKQRGFPRMLGSLDCMHWKWKNCPTAWAGRYAGRGSNDINVLETSPLFSNLARGISPCAHYVISGKEFNMGYYLADGIYPTWATLVQSISKPEGPKKIHFVQKQEACRKDVERAFGVLQSRFAIVANPARFWSKEDLQDVIYACIIMHNMIIEDERDLNVPISLERDVPTS